MNSQHRDAGLRDDLLFIVVTFAISWACMLAPLTGTARTIFVTIGSFGPTFGALVIAAKQGGAKSVVASLKRFISFRAPFYTYLLAWYLFPAILFLTFLAFGFTADKADTGTIALGIVVFAPLNYTVGVLAFGTAGPQGEELGWRGYLLPRWKVRFGEAASPLLLGLVWTTWHLPLFLDPNWVAQGISFGFNLATYTASVVALSYALAFVSWLSKNNLVVCILMHGAINLSFNMLIGYAGPLHDDGKMQHIVMVITSISVAVVSGLLWSVVRKKRSVEARAA